LQMLLNTRDSNGDANAVKKGNDREKKSSAPTLYRYFKDRPLVAQEYYRKT